MAIITITLSGLQMMNGYVVQDNDRAVADQQHLLLQMVFYLAPPGAWERRGDMDDGDHTV